MVNITEITNGLFRTPAKVNPDIVEKMTTLLSTVFDAYAENGNYGKLDPLVADKVNFICLHIADLMDRIDYVYARTNGTYGELAPSVADQLKRVYDAIRQFNKKENA